MRLAHSCVRSRVIPALIPAFIGAVALLAGSAVCLAQSADLPPAPEPNRSSLQNPFWGSVTVQPETDEIIKLTLPDAVNRGLATNLGLKEAETGERTLHGQLVGAVQYFLPSVTVTGGHEVAEYNLAAFGFTQGFLKKIAFLFPGGLPTDLSFITKANVTTGQVNYEQTLLSGVYFDGYRAVRAAQKVAFYQDQSARGEVVQQVATAYLASLAAQAQVENAKSLLAADKVLLDQAHDKHEAGVVANLDELRARVQYQQQEQTVVAYENLRDKDEILLRREIGLAPGQKIELTDSTPYNDLAQRTQDDLRDEAYANRQDYQNLQAQQVELKMALRARKAERFPTLSFRGNYGVTGVTGVGYHGTLLAEGNLNFPIFREATLRGDADVARAQLAGAQLQLNDLKGKIDQQVRAAILDVNATKQLVEVARSNVDLATRELSDETDRFNAGIDDTLPLVQAQATLASAQDNLVQSLYQYNQAKLSLARSTGLIETKYRAYLGR